MEEMTVREDKKDKMIGEEMKTKKIFQRTYCQELRGKK